MANKQDLLDFYGAVLRSASMEVEDNGCVNIALPGQEGPKLIEGQRLVTPTKEQLANPNWEERIAFHPVEENILRGESKIIETLRRDFNTKVNLSVCTLLYELMTIASSKADQAKLSPDQIQILTLVPEASEKDTDFLKALFKKMAFDNPAMAPVSLYIKRGGRTGDKGWRRLGVASFPLFQELTNGEAKVFGVKPPSTKVRDNVTKLLNYILPNQSSPESYSQGSDDETAPYFDALLKLFVAVAAPINDACHAFASAITDTDGILLEADWIDAASDLTQYKRLIPSLKGNQGNSAEDQEAEANATPAAAPAAAAPAARPAPAPTNWVPGQVAQPAAAPRGPGGGVKFGDLLRSSPALGQVHQQQQQQHQGSYFPPQPGAPMPGAGAPSNTWQPGSAPAFNQPGGYRI
jgi:hypothetical protein